MTVNDYLRMMAGFFIMASVALGFYVSPYFLLFTAFVGLNLFQSAFTKWCPAMTLLRGCGVKDPDCDSRTSCCAPKAKKGGR